MQVSYKQLRRMVRFASLCDLPALVFFGLALWLAVEAVWLIGRLEALRVKEGLRYGIVALCLLIRTVGFVVFSPYFLEQYFGQF